MNPTIVDRGALFGDPWIYRYTLWRTWDPGKGRVNFIGLNPSTATADTDDNTIRRCVQFAYRWGFGGMVMTNIFAFRTKDPDVMKAREDPVGPRNDHHLVEQAKASALVIAAWGVHGEHLGRGRIVYELLQKDVTMRCFRMTKDGHPFHPLYQPYDVEIIRYTPLAAGAP